MLSTHTKPQPSSPCSQLIEVLLRLEMHAFRCAVKHRPGSAATTPLATPSLMPSANPMWLGSPKLGASRRQPVVVTVASPRSTSWATSRRSSSTPSVAFPPPSRITCKAAATSHPVMQQRPLKAFIAAASSAASPSPLGSKLAAAADGAGAAGVVESGVAASCCDGAAGGATALCHGVERRDVRTFVGQWHNYKHTIARHLVW